MPVGMAVEGVIADRVWPWRDLRCSDCCCCRCRFQFGWPWPLVAAQAATFGGLLLLSRSPLAFTRHSPRFLQPVAKAVRRFAAHVAGAGRPGWQLGLAAASIALFAAMLVLLGLGLSLHISLWIALAVTPAIYLSQVIPIFYAGFGSREIALAALLVPSGVLTRGSDAVALGLSIGLCNLAASLPGAVSAWPLLRASGEANADILAAPETERTGFSHETELRSRMTARCRRTGRWRRARACCSRHGIWSAPPCAWSCCRIRKANGCI